MFFERWLIPSNDDFFGSISKCSEYRVGSFVCFYEDDCSKNAKKPYKISTGLILGVCAPFFATDDPQLYLAIMPLDEPGTRIMVAHSHIVQSFYKDIDFA